MPTQLEVNSISKSFNDKSLYSNISFVFNPGCYAFIGPNGTGKTVLLDMLAGVLSQDSGTITLSDTGNSDSLAYKNKLAYIPAKPSFFPKTKGAEFLNFISAINHVSSASLADNELIHAFHFSSYLSTAFSDMSLGTQKKLFLITLSIGNKSLFILDEPSNGLDLDAKRALVQFLSSKAKHTIIVMATHDSFLLEMLNPAIIKLSQTPLSQFKLINQGEPAYDEIIL